MIPTSQEFNLIRSIEELLSNEHCSYLEVNNLEIEKSGMKEEPMNSYVITYESENEKESKTVCATIAVMKNKEK